MGIIMVHYVTQVTITKTSGVVGKLGLNLNFIKKNVLSLEICI